MARLEDVELVERLFLKGYPFHRYAPRPDDPVAHAMTPLRKPLSACTVAVITTAGLSLPEQPPFDTTNKMGDSSFREFPGDIDPQLLEMNHRSWAFDQTGILRDRNLVMPLDRLREMQNGARLVRWPLITTVSWGQLLAPTALLSKAHLR